MKTKTLFFLLSVLSIVLIAIKLKNPSQTIEVPLPSKIVKYTDDSLRKTFAALPIERLEKMQKAGKKIQKWNAILARMKGNILSEIFQSGEAFFELDHYPQGDVFDSTTASHYFYHSHRGNEHGHFHLFLHDKEAKKDDPFAHLIALSLDEKGVPKSVFTTNQWVTGETWQDAKTLIEKIDSFSITHAFPSWPTNRLLGAFIQLFYPQIVTALQERDKMIGEHDTSTIFADKRLEVITEIPISIQIQINLINEVLLQKQAVANSQSF